MQPAGLRHRRERCGRPRQILRPARHRRRRNRPPCATDRVRDNDAMTTARGTFEVALKQISTADEAPLGRMTIDKTFHGDLEGTSRGQMMSVLTETQGSAGYVAIELVTGTLNGKTGMFLLQHSGLMVRGMGTLTINVIPD